MQFTTQLRPFAVVTLIFVVGCGSKQERPEKKGSENAAISAQDLASAFEKDIAATNKEYDKRVIRINGTIIDQDDRFKNGTRTIHLRGTQEAFVVCEFAANQPDTDKLRYGQSITVEGKFFAVPGEKRGITLNNCRLIDASAYKRPTSHPKEFVLFTASDLLSKAAKDKQALESQMKDSSYIGRYRPMVVSGVINSATPPANAASGDPIKPQPVIVIQSKTGTDGLIECKLINPSELESLKPGAEVTLVGKYVSCFKGIGGEPLNIKMLNCTIY